MIIGIGPAFAGSGERTCRISHELLRSGHDARFVISDRWYVEGKPPAGFPFPSERVLALPSLNDRYNICTPSLHALRREVDAADVVHLQGVFWPTALLVGVLALRRKKALVVSTNGSWPLRGRSMPLKLLVHRLAANRLIRNARAIVAITASERDALRELAGTGTEIAVIPNGVARVDDARTVAEFRERFAVGDGPFIVFIGRLDPIKGIDLLIEGFARTAADHAHRLVIAGSGAEDERLRRLAQECGVAERISFVGHLTPEWRTAAIRAASFVAIPSRHDAMTLVALEAAIEARPVLITRTCDFPEMTTADGGLTVDPDPASIQVGIEWMLAHEPDWPEMGRRLSELARRYSWQQAANHHLEVYARALER